MTYAIFFLQKNCKTSHKNSRQATTSNDKQRNAKQLDLTMKISFALPLLACTASAFMVAPATSPRHSMKLHMFETVEAAIAEAQRICANDPSGPECKVAWDIVEELEAADSQRGAFSAPNTAAPADAQLANLMGSFDILMTKIDGKMDQLKGTTERMGQLGSNDPYLAKLGYRADEMKQALANARASMGQY
jgi:hypothetical protein